MYFILFPFISIIILSFKICFKPFLTLKVRTKNSYLGVAKPACPIFFIIGNLLGVAPCDGKRAN